MKPDGELGELDGEGDREHDRERDRTRDDSGYEACMSHLED